MTLLAALLALDAIFHAFVIYQFGVRQNEPFLVYAIIDAALTVAVFFAVPYAVWATLVLALLGLIGLTVTFNRPQREKSLDRAIFVFDVLIVAWSAYLLIAG